MASDNHPGDRGTAVSTAAAATINNVSGKITTEALTTGVNLIYTLILTNSLITPNSVVFVSVANGTNTTEGCYVRSISTGTGSSVIKIANAAAGALNGTIVISFIVF